MKITIDVAAIVSDESAYEQGSYLLWVTFDRPPGVAPGTRCRTFAAGDGWLAASPDSGSILALWRDGNRLLVQPEGGWCATRGHVVLP